MVEWETVTEREGQMFKDVLGKVKTKLAGVRREAQNKKRIKDAQQRGEKKP